MADIAIKVDRLSKRYRIGVKEERADTFVGSVVNFLKSPGRNFRRLQNLTNFKEDGAAAPQDVIWALREVSFEVRQGEVIGVIGRNGAGKSTLLKILSRITYPTSGRIELMGRVASLLEVGTGFHQDLTGRENIYLNGTILGMTKAEIDKKFDEIVDFSGIEKFIDTPVKRYSSGMGVRLAFSVAAHLEPEILLVDEVLAVGDAEFQKKCLGKMGEVASEGRTVLFVSHNMATVSNLCAKTLVFGGGKIAFEGPTPEGIARYMDLMAGSHAGEIDVRDHPARKAGSQKVFSKIRFLDPDGNLTTGFLPGHKFTIEFVIAPGVNIPQPHFGIGFDDSFGTRVFSLITQYSGIYLPGLKGEEIIRCTIEQLPLAPGTYTLSLSAGTFQVPLMDAIENAVRFEVLQHDFFGSGKLPYANLGSVLIRSDWKSHPRF